MNTFKKPRQKFFDIQNNTHLGILLGVVFVGALALEVTMTLATTHDPRCLVVKCIVVK